MALENLKTVFQCFRDANLTLKPKKCALFQSEVSYLGHVVSEQGVSCDPKKTEAVRDWPQPCSVTDVRSFLGLASYYRKFIPNFSTIAAPLTELTQKNKQFCWSESCEQAFQNLKNLLSSPPVLAYPVEDAPFILDTDASLTGVGGVLSQIQSGEERVIAYASQSLNKAQRNYCTTHRELLAVVTFIQHFRHYLIGRNFLIRTDHASLTWLKNFRNAEGMLARWLVVIDMYDFHIEHRKGSLHGNADGLSRRSRVCKRVGCPDCLDRRKPSSETTTASMDTDAPEEDVLAINLNRFANVCPIQGAKKQSAATKTQEPNWLDTWTKDEIRNMQREDPDIGEFLKLQESGQGKPSRDIIHGLPPDVRKLCQQWELLATYEQGVLCHQSEAGRDGSPCRRIVAPQILRDSIMEKLHNARTAGHLGRDKTKEAVMRRFYWPGLATDVKRWCLECDSCARRKPGPGFGKAPLCSTLQQVRQPLDRIAIDIVGGLATTRNGNRYIMVVADYFSKWTEAYAIHDHTASTVADKLLTEFICRFGAPSQIHTDQGREFEGELFTHLCRKLGVNKSRTTPYHPQSDGLVERFNRTLIQMLSIFVNDRRDDWDDHLPFVLMAYRASVHSSTGCTPNLIMLGRETNCPLDLMVGIPDQFPPDLCPNMYVNWMQKSMRRSFAFVHGSLGIAASRQEQNYDQGLRCRAFQAGDWVWRWYPPAVANKLGQGWTGPYLVIRKISTVTYSIQRSAEGPVISIHVDQLKPYSGRNPPANWGSFQASNNPDPSSQAPLPPLSPLPSPPCGANNQNIRGSEEEGHDKVKTTSGQRSGRTGQRSGLDEKTDVKPDVVTRSGRKVKPRDILSI